MRNATESRRGHPTDFDLSWLGMRRWFSGVDEFMARATVRAVIDGVVVAESDDVKIVEGMSYFPIDAVDMSRLEESPTRSQCFWKGRAHYWHVQGEDTLALDSAFSYPKPWPLARRLVSGRIAFWRGVQIQQV